MALALRLTHPRSEAALDEALSRPTPATVARVGGPRGDVLILGAGGKLGLSLARMARRGLDRPAGASARVTAVSRFGNPSTLASFHAAGLDTLVHADLLADGALGDAARGLQRRVPGGA